MQRFLELDANLDLRLFSQFLWQQGIVHRISEEQGQQVLWLEQPDQAEDVRDWFEDWQRGDLVLSTEAPMPRDTAQGYRWRQSLQQFPVSCGFLLVCVLIGLWTGLGTRVGQTVELLLLKPELVGNEVTGFLSLSETLASGQWWRLFSPALLHFGWMHLLFNMLWLHELGKRIEPRFGALFMLLFILAAGVASNLIQYGYGGGSALFGGFSGIVYALLGFIWVYQWRRPQVQFYLPRGVIGFMLIWLLLGVSGLFDQLFGAMANAAHIGGLLSGLLCGWLAAVLGLKLKGEQNGTQ